MDKNTWIGFLLIAVIVVGFTMFGSKKAPKESAQQPKQELILPVEQAQQPEQVVASAPEKPVVSKPAEMGVFTPALTGEEKMVSLENEHLRVTLSTLGGTIERAELLEYKAAGDTVNPLCLFFGSESSMSFSLQTAENGTLHTAKLYFEPVPTDSANTAVLRMPTSDPEAWIDFVYTLSEDYMLRFEVAPHNMQAHIAPNVSSIRLDWIQLIPQQEQGRKFEERYAQLQYMLVGGEMEKLSESKEDREQESTGVKWIGYKDQFFSTVLIADDAFRESYFHSIPQQRQSGYIKKYETATLVPFDPTSDASIGFRYYLGPNHYNTLKAYDNGKEKEEKLYLKKLVPLGWKIVSWINTALVIPMFDLFSGWGLHIGWIIVLMTLVIKLIILPFVFVSYKSSAKMRALKPQIDEINAKYPAEKMQERQAATMQLYRQAGVSPMSGCLPMLFQFPVLMAMFWFLPTAIELRGKSLFWADDLSTYDAVFHWGTNIPLLGDHLSLFCLLMTICNIVYTYITMQSQNTDPSMKFMKYMMYAMPLMFLFIFNDYAAGLSFYYLVSLFITIFQTMIFRWTLDDKKMLAEIEANKKKRAGKPQSKFMQRLEQMQREQQQMARENAKKNMRR
jgi:YidC/Oxa1 family membrane protein insertase